MMSSSAARTRAMLAAAGLCLAALVAGAAVTVVVAWGCAAYTHPGINGLGFTPEDPRWPVPVPADWPERPASCVESPSAFGSEAEFRAEKPGPILCIVCVSSSGWPWPAMWQYGTVEVDPRAPGLYRVTPGGCITISEAVRSGIGAVRPGLPTRPIPLGFVLCTLFYAAPFLLALGMLGFGRPALRRVVRRRRGQCPACGYSLAGNIGGICPECGGQGATPRTSAGE